MKKTISSIVGVVITVETALAAGPVGTDKYSVKPAPTLMNSTTKLVVAEDLQKPPENQDAEGKEGLADERSMGVGRAASDMGSMVLNFFSSAVNVANVLRTIFAK